MKKNILITILTLVFCLFMAVPGLAESENAEDGFADEYYRLMDMASLLSDADVDSLTAKLDELSLRQKMDVVIATTNTLEGKLSSNTQTISTIIAASVTVRIATD